jgi:hypothetical protein
MQSVQDLGLPVRWNYLTNFSSDVSRLVLLSERGRRTEAYGEGSFIPIGCAQGYVTIGE